MTTEAAHIAHEQYPAPIDATRSWRPALVFSLATVAAITAVCLPFLLGIAYPEALTFVGRWIPLVIALIVMAVMPVGGRPLQLLGLHPGGWRPLISGVLTAIGVFLALAFGPALVAQWWGWGEMLSWSVIGAALLQLPLWIAIYSASTIGEEAAWRGYAHQLLRHRGFWFTASVVGAAWAALHVPQLLIFAVSGEMTVGEALAGVVSIFFTALPLAALVERFRSVWPAVIGHAVPFTAATLVPGADLTSVWAITALAAVASVVATVIVRPRATVSSR